MAKKRKQKWVHRVVDNNRNDSILEYCVGNFPILGSKSAVKKALAGRRLLLNGSVALFSDTVKKGDLLELQGTGVHKAKKYDISLEVVYEDDFIIIINKPGGIAVNGSRNKTVENALADLNSNNRQPDALPRPQAVHRIDVPTTGLVLLAKTKGALIKLSRAFQENKVKKEYLAVVHGKPPQEGRIDAPLSGKRAITEYETLLTVPSRIFQHLSLVKLLPATGRTHQLRIHFKDQGHFIVGDKLYAEGRKTILGKGLLLCASRLQFIHPIHGEWIDSSIDAPAKFEKIMQREKERA